MAGGEETNAGEMDGWNKKQTSGTAAGGR